MTSATRRLGVAIALALLLGGLFGVWWRSIGTPVAEARPITTGALRIVVFGDSLAFGWGTTHPARDGLAPRLASRFAATRPGSTLVNASFPGSTIEEIAPSNRSGANRSAPLRSAVDWRRVCSEFGNMASGSACKGTDEGCCPEPPERLHTADVDFVGSTWRWGR
jgi:hypothetical protein